MKDILPGKNEVHLQAAVLAWAALSFDAKYLEKYNE